MARSRNRLTFEIDGVTRIVSAGANVARDARRPRRVLACAPTRPNVASPRTMPETSNGSVAMPRSGRSTSTACTPPRTADGISSSTRMWSARGQADRSVYAPSTLSPMPTAPGTSRSMRRPARPGSNAQSASTSTNSTTRPAKPAYTPTRPGSSQRTPAPATAHANRRVGMTRSRRRSGFGGCVKGEPGTGNREPCLRFVGLIAAARSKRQ